ncbi:MAG: phosphatase PAP2 family protein, partial [Planctomycetes bacterium]|nr:phosphatase PAP2 family protein [Planctomycetota bacterium]
TNCMLVTLAHWRSPRRYWLLPWAVLIAISTITTGQHVFIDILGGILLACVGTLAGAWLWGPPLDSIDEDRSNQEPRVG